MVPAPPASQDSVATPVAGSARGEPADVPAMVAPPPGNPRFPLFDSLRAIAALSVFFAHTAIVSNRAPWFETWAPELAKLGVCIFFLISGFLLYRPFVAARWGDAKEIRVRDFARRRVLRIVPAYWFALAVIVIFFETGLNSGNWWIFPAFGQIYQAETFDLGISPAWTLSIEMSFYALLPVFAYVAGRLSARRASAWPDVVLLVVLAGASLVFHAQFVDSTNPTVASTLPGTFYWFALGMGLAVASVASAHSPRMRSVTSFIGRWATPGWILAVAGFVLLSVTSTPTGFHSGSLEEHVLLGLMALLILLPAVFGETLGGAARRVLALRWLAWIGLVSYAFYLWHYYVMIALRSHRLHALNQHYILFVVMSFVGAAAIAAGSYYVIERPVLRFKR